MGPDSSDCILTLSSPAVKEEYTVGHQLCIQSIQLDTSSAFRVYSWKPAVHSKYTAGKQQCIQSIQLETSSVFKVYSQKPALHSKYTTRHQQCIQSIQLETSSAETYCSSEPALRECSICRSLPTYFKLLYLLSHSSKLIQSYINLRWLNVGLNGLVCFSVKV